MSVVRALNDFELVVTNLRRTRDTPITEYAILRKNYIAFAII